LSKFRAGDLVEVLSEAEILQTLDENGCFDGMPFMPEMLQFCGKQLRVSAVAHKTCETNRETWTGRRLNRTVHLTGARCDGSAHGGCEAECLLFWKDAWLKPAALTTQSPYQPTTKRADSISVADLIRLTRTAQSDASTQECFSCQATQMWNATSELQPWDIRQYVYDVATGNHSLGRVLRVLWIGILRDLASRRKLARYAPFAHQLVQSILEVTHKGLTGRKAPYLNPPLDPGKSTPIDAGSLGLSPGDYVRVKSQSEIEQTLDKHSRNRGLSFDTEEMAPYCGKIFRVKKIVKKIIHEPSGKMLTLKYPCITLEGVVCNAEYARCRLNCPRQIPAYWREFWLERADSSVAHAHLAQTNSSLEIGKATAAQSTAISTSSEGSVNR
jgi:hypothetical protein